MVTGLDVSDVCDEKIVLKAINDCKGFSILNCRWSYDDEIASPAIQFYL